MSDWFFHKSAPGGRFLACALCIAVAGPAGAAALTDGLTVGGSVAATTDYIYQGLSQSDGHGAIQGDLHLANAGGTFLGAWASSRDSDLQPGAPAILQLYLGHRFESSGAWSTTLSARSYYYIDASSYEPSGDYFELAARVSYLDRWSFSVTAVPNAVRYWDYIRLSRSPAYVADASCQWLLVSDLFFTAGAGYYYSTGTGPGIERATGYAYGNVGLAYEHRAWRLDVGYFLTQEAAQRSFPYPVATHKFAATLAWRF
ncbi:MAG TPA: TorF family putative porin [Steroidobacteraceae bacterium]|nr:TorF family putative porin [Steroidobacteraceae bacterium]